MPGDAKSQCLGGRHEAGLARAMVLLFLALQHLNSRSAPSLRGCTPAHFTCHAAAAARFRQRPAGAVVFPLTPSYAVPLMYSPSGCSGTLPAASSGCSRLPARAARCTRAHLLAGAHSLAEWLQRPASNQPPAGESLFLAGTTRCSPAHSLAERLGQPPAIAAVSPAGAAQGSPLLICSWSGCNGPPPAASSGCSCPPRRAPAAAPPGTRPPRSRRAGAPQYRRNRIGTW